MKAFLIALTALLATAAWAKPNKTTPAPAPAAADTENVADAESTEAPAAYGWEPGPKTLQLGNDVNLSLPEGHVFLEKGQAAKLLEANGSFHHDNLLGMVASANEKDPWFVVIRFDQEGYIKDNEEIDAKELLEAIREGQLEANKERQQRGFSELTIGEWTVAPHYERSVHHLVWALTAIAPDGSSVNYNTRVLGRRGVVSLNLVTGPEEVEAAKPEVAKLLGGTTFAQGARYEDFQDGDHVAEYGLAGLVLGGAGLGAAKLVKIGLLAKFGKGLLALLIADKKLIVVAVVGLFALIKRLFGGKSPAES